MKTIPIYRTKDYSYASILLATSHHLIDREWENNICYFVFENKDDCDKTIIDYLNGKIMINAKELWEAIRTIKDILSQK